MAIVCNGCGNLMDDFDLTCPRCGTPVGGSRPHSDNVPATIDELRKYAEFRHMPLDQLRFFIGIDYKLPKAFGIYRDTKSGEFIVYKNKADGTRSIRYKGFDEAFAVNELYQKLLEEHASYLKQKIQRTARPVEEENTRRPVEDENERRPGEIDPKGLLFSLMCTAAILIVAAIIASINVDKERRENTRTYTLYHYEYKGTEYLFDTQDSGWYGYSSIGLRTRVDPPEDFLDHKAAYFDHSETYSVTTTHSGSSGSSYSDNDSGSWSGGGSDSDSGGGTDWNSDW